MLLQTSHRKSYTAYPIASFLMTLSNFHGHVLIASLLKYDFSYSCAAIDMISANTARRAVPLR